MWFQQLTGFEERSGDDVRSNIDLDGVHLHSKPNGQRMRCGSLELPTLKQLRERRNECSVTTRLSVCEVVADVTRLHADPRNSGATFQVASQFNLLEMVSPGVSPENGIDCYENDLTQGPACAIACGAGTIYRNYFVEVDGRQGQTTDRQLDCLELLGQSFGNHDSQLWEMRNGYALATSDGLRVISERLASATEAKKDEYRSQLMIGIQSGVQVVVPMTEHTVTQVYCSALPVAYSMQEAHEWQAFATLILEAAYESTFFAALENAERTGNRTLFLTLLGGGAFGNDQSWIFAAIRRSLMIFDNSGLDVRIVSYGRSNTLLVKFLHELQGVG